MAADGVELGVGFLIADPFDCSLDAARDMAQDRFSRIVRATEGLARPVAATESEALSARTTADENPKQIRNSNVRMAKTNGNRGLHGFSQIQATKARRHQKSW